MSPALRCVALRCVVGDHVTDGATLFLAQGLLCARTDKGDVCMCCYSTARRCRVKPVPRTLSISPCIALGEARAMVLSCQQGNHGTVPAVGDSDHRWATIPSQTGSRNRLRLKEQPHIKSCHPPRLSLAIACTALAMPGRSLAPLSSAVVPACRCKRRSRGKACTGTGLGNSVTRGRAHGFPEPPDVTRA